MFRGNKISGKGEKHNPPSSHLKFKWLILIYRLFMSYLMEWHICFSLLANLAQRTCNIHGIRRGRDRMVVGFTTTCAISAYHLCLEFEPHYWWGVLDTTSCDKVCQWLAAGRWFSPHTMVSSTNKTDRHDITEILLKWALN